jgi:hypothetical protein
MKKVALYFLSVFLLLACVTKEVIIVGEIEEDEVDFETVTEWVMCADVTFTNELTSCLMITITSSLGVTEIEDCIVEDLYYCFNFPAEEEVSFELSYKDECDVDHTYSEIIGPYNFEPSLAEIEITVDNSENYPEYVISGNALSCSNSPIINGAAILDFNGIQSIEIIEDGTFAFEEIGCYDTGNYSVTIIDFDTDQMSLETTFTTDTTSIDLGTISTCNPLQEMIRYQISDHPIIHYQSVDFVADINEFFRHILYESADEKFSLRWGEGGLSLSLIDTNGDLSHGSFDPSLIITVHQEGGLGEFYYVSFRGHTAYLDPNTGYVLSKPIEGFICVIEDM